MYCTVHCTVQVYRCTVLYSVQCTVHLYCTVHCTVPMYNCTVHSSITNSVQSRMCSITRLPAASASELVRENNDIAEWREILFYRYCMDRYCFSDLTVNNFVEGIDDRETDWCVLI